MSGIDNREFIIRHDGKLYGIDIDDLREEVIIEDIAGLLARVDFAEIDAIKNNDDIIFNQKQRHNIIEEITAMIEDLNFTFEDPCYIPAQEGY